MSILLQPALYRLSPMRPTDPLQFAYYEPSDSDEDSPLCVDCYHLHMRGGIHDYYYKPAPIFYGNGPRFFGVELEIDGAGEDSDNARELLNVGNPYDLEHIYCKHDGSPEDGIEIVSHPSFDRISICSFPRPSAQLCCSRYPLR